MGTKIEMFLLSFLLQNTISLDSLILIHPMISLDGELLRNKLSRFKASPHAQIIISRFLDYDCQGKRCNQARKVKNNSFYC